jgi:hypothetical protein
MWRLCQARDILADKLTRNFLFHLDYDFEMPFGRRDWQLFSNELARAARERAHEWYPF